MIPESLRQGFASDLCDAACILRLHPEWSDEQIAQRSGGFVSMTPKWVTTLRHVNEKRPPLLVSHRDIVRWCMEVAWIAGWDAPTETALRTGPRKRLIPDLVIRDPEDDTPVAVVEVKPIIRNDAEMAAAVRQVSRYADRLEDDEPRGVLAAVVAWSINVHPGYALMRGVETWDLSDYLAETTRPGGRLYRGTPALSAIARKAS